MFTKNALHSFILFVGVLILTISTTASAKTTQYSLDTAAIDTYIENHWNGKKSFFI